MTVEELQVLITANTTALRNEINKANKNINSLKKSADKTQKGVTSAFSKLKTGIISLGIGKVIADSIKTGMDAIESDSLFDTSLGKMADSVRAWSDEIADALGLNAVAMRKNTGVIYNMTTSMGLAQDNALKMSKGITLLTEDMASFYNLSSAEAFNKLRAGLTGEAEPLKALGILVNENTIKQVAYSEGIAETGAELTEQQKVLARYVAILKQTGNAQGDLARTINSPANQLRILKNQVSQLGLAFSNFLMPVISAVLPYITAFTKVVTTALNSLSKLLGLKGGSSKGTANEVSKISTGLGDVNSGLDNANKTAKKLKGNLAGFDEMNVLQDNSSDSGSSGSSGGGATGGDLGFDLGEYDAHLDSLDSNIDKIAEKIRGAFAKIGEGIDFNKVTDSFVKLGKALEPITVTLFDGLKWAWDNVLVPLSQWTIGDLLPAFLNAVSGALTVLSPIIEDTKDVLTWLVDNFLSPVASFTGGIIVDLLNGIGDALSWIGKHQVAVAIIEGLGIAIVGANLAIIAYIESGTIMNAIMSIGTAVTGAFGTAMAFLTSPITLVTLAIGLLIAGIILLVKNWDTVKAKAKEVWENIKVVWGNVKDWFNNNVIEPVKNFFANMWNNLKTGAVNSWNGIKSVFSNVGNFFETTFKNAWKRVKAVFSTGGKIFDGIKEGIVSSFKSVVNKLIDGINKVIATPFNKINSILNDIRGISVLGAKPFKGLWGKNPLPVPKIPKLARGGIVDSPTIAEIGEAGKEAIVPLERTEWVDKLADKINSNSNGDTPVQFIVKIGEDTILDKVIDGIHSKNFETNGEVFSV